MAFPINPPTVAMVDSKLLPTREWWLFFLNIQKLIGTSQTNPFDDSTLLGITDAGATTSHQDMTALLMNQPAEAPPQYYMPPPVDPGALTAGSGLTGGGNMGGNVTINVGAGSGITVGADSISLTKAASYALFDHYTTVGNSGTTETDLYSDTTAAGQLAANGDKFEAEYGGSFVSSGTATRQIKIYFGGTAIFDTGALTLSLSSAWTAYVTIIRVSATVIRYMISMTTEGAALAAYTAVGELTGLTLSSTNVLKVTGTAAGVGAASDDVLIKLGTVSYIPAAA
jgi:hypothetical protein